MTSRERLLLAAHGRIPDRVPVAPYMGNHGARVAGVPIGAYCQSGQLMAEAQFRAWQLYGQDAVVAQSDNYYIVALDHKASLREARQRLGPNVCLMDNLDPVECLWRGPPAGVTASARAAITAAGPGAFVLGSGCEGPVAAPQESLRTMVAAAQA